jgi:hypothetical protein
MAGKDYSTIGSSSNKKESYSTSHAFSSGNSGAKKTSTSFNGGGGTNNRENYRTTTYTTTKVSAATKRRNELALKVAKEKKDAEAFKNYSYTKPTGLARFSPLVQVMDITGIGKKTFEVNKSYYERNVIGKAKPGGGFYGASIDDYKGYMQGRGSGTVDAMGRTINNRDEGSGSYIVEKNIGGRTLLTTTPTTAEVSQSKAAQAEDSIELKKRRVKAKGRSPTIMTGVTGATGGLTLGKPSLLGM